MSFFRSIWRNHAGHKRLKKGDEVSVVFGEDTIDGVSTFSVKYLGSIGVETESDAIVTADAVKAILSMVRAKRKKCPRVSVVVSTEGIHIMDLNTCDSVLDASIFRISYCSADAAHGHVFAFISTNENGTMECHALHCSNRKAAQTMSLTVSRIFNAAYRSWQMSQTPRLLSSSEEDSTERDILYKEKNELLKEELIDFDQPIDLPKGWVCFEDDTKENFDRICMTRINSWDYPTF